MTDGSDSSNSKPDFGKEDLKGTLVEYAPGAWVSGEAHAPGGIASLPVNNRMFVFRLRLEKALAGVSAGKDCLFVFGCPADSGIAAVQKLEKDTGLKAVALMNNGGGHHVFLRKWYLAFPDMRIWITPTRVPQTANGGQLREEFEGRWELVDNTTVPHHAHQLLEFFGDKQIDCVLMDQIYGYPDSDSVAFGNWKDSESKAREVPWTDFLTKWSGLSQKQVWHMDEPVFYHRASKLIITGHHFEFAYLPPDYTPPDELVGHGWFYKYVMPKMFFRPGSYDTTLGVMMLRLYDAQVHAEQWQEVMKWDFQYGCSHHDPVNVCGPLGSKEIMDGEGGLKGHVTRVLTASGELTAAPDAGSWWPWRGANALSKVQQSEAGFVQKYGEPPVLAKGGPEYDGIGMKK